MNWFAQYVIEPNGLINWREGMRVTDPSLVEAYDRNPLICLTLGICSQSGVRVGEA